jgi:hypothetical protein
MRVRSRQRLGGSDARFCRVGAHQITWPLSLTWRVLPPNCVCLGTWQGVPPLRSPCVCGCVPASTAPRGAARPELLPRQRGRRCPHSLTDAPYFPGHPPLPVFSGGPGPHVACCCWSRLLVPSCAAPASRHLPARALASRASAPAAEDLWSCPAWVHGSTGDCCRLDHVAQVHSVAWRGASRGGDESMRGRASCV